MLCKLQHAQPDLCDRKTAGRGETLEDTGLLGLAAFFKMALFALEVAPHLSALNLSCTLGSSQ